MPTDDQAQGQAPLILPSIELRRGLLGARLGVRKARAERGFNLELSVSRAKEPSTELAVSQSPPPNPRALLPTSTIPCHYPNSNVASCESL